MTTFTAYHGTNASFRRFDTRKTAQGLIWFSSDKETIERGESGAEGTARILELRVTIDRPAGWREYDQLLLDEIEERGFDGVILPRKDGFDGFVFDPKQIEIVRTLPSYRKNPFNKYGNRIEGVPRGFGYTIDYDKEIAQDERELRDLEAIAPISRSLASEERTALQNGYAVGLSWILFPTGTPSPDPERLSLLDLTPEEAAGLATLFDIPGADGSYRLGETVNKRLHERFGSWLDNLLTEEQRVAQTKKVKARLARHKRNAGPRPNPISRADIEDLGRAYIEGEDIAHSPEAQAMAREQAGRVHRAFDDLRRHIRIEIPEAALSKGTLSEGVEVKVSKGAPWQPLYDFYDPDASYDENPRIPESDLRLDIAPGIPVRGSVKSLHPIYDRTRGELNVPEGYAVRLQHIGRSQFNAVDPLAIYVPERLTHDYALHPHAWRWTFGALTGKDGKKIRYYKPVLVPIRPGTLVAEMKFASRFLHDPEDVESARLYQSSVQPLKTANLSDYEQPELLIPRTCTTFRAGRKHGPWTPSEREAGREMAERANAAERRRKSRRR